MSKETVTLPAVPETLPDDPETLKAMIRELLAQLRNSRRHEEQLQNKVSELLAKLFGRKSEKIDPNQLSLIDLESLGLAPVEAVEPPVELVPEPTPRRKGHGRRRPAKELPRRRVVHEVPESERLCPCCGKPKEVIREEVSEQLDFQPASFYINEHVRLVYACRKGCQEAPVIAPKPPQPIDKGLPGPGLLAQVAISKYCDHLPLHRQEGIYRRQGVELSRSTMCGWIRDVAGLVAPVVDELKRELLCSDLIGTDDTTVPVLDPGRKTTATGRLWVYVGDDDHPVVLFDYTLTRERAGPANYLDGYKGFLQADAYSGYDGIYAGGTIQEVACWMHARRYFYKASQADPARPCVALALIQQLYQVEKAAKGFSPEQRHAHRQEHAVPILDRLEEWMKIQEAVTPPKSLLGDALRYSRNQWQALRRYTEDGRLPIDNGRSERALRQIALGRNNWLFAGSDEGGRRAAALYTIFETCKRNRIEPFAYLRDLLAQIPTWPAERIAELTPLAWAKRRQAQLAAATAGG
jgi:transposase